MSEATQANIIKNLILDESNNVRMNRGYELLKWNIDYDNFINVLEAYTLDHYPEVARLKDIMNGTGAEKVLMSGSGPTVFAVYNDMKAAMSACDKLRDKGYEAYWTKTIK